MSVSDDADTMYIYSIHPHIHTHTHKTQICNHADLAAGADADGHDIMRGLVAGGGWRDEWAEEGEEEDEVGGWVGFACVII